MKISKHFHRYEVACKCGCGFDSMDAKTLEVADALRDYLGIPLTPNSGCRCPRHNKRVGGAKQSQHLRARAMDIPVPDPGRAFAWLLKTYPGVYGFGRYRTFVHIDTRSGSPARWTSY